ncbi:MAG TPA: prepilin-type N-terminal cleavage/methylation domain-containing protein [Candidatus Omnitrophota bacterium]|nr:prepilin-type N-terminal cleavage/methylation domain-containing protein [Candidatus Omnitrophota bacterium]HSA30820.1 prepilin-type N-terminal cleavage/methylation domain-containing protein [Candidatus Omnitrophota bacterium]
MKRHLNKGFTLLELVIVIVIVGVLMSIALPKLFKVIETSRIVEAQGQISAIRSALERHYLMTGSYERPQGWGQENDWQYLGIEDPDLAPGAHFEYWIHDSAHYILARRNARDGGLPEDGIQFWITTGIKDYIWCGQGRYVGKLKECEEYH